jgi:hypothetical protein
MIGRCFRTDHVVVVCSYPARCLHCHQERASSVKLQEVAVA